MLNTRLNTAFFNNASINSRSINSSSVNSHDINVRPLSQPFGLLLGLLLLAVFCCSITPQAFAANPANTENLAAKTSLKPLYTTADKAPAPVDNAVLASALQKIENPGAANSQPEATETPATAAETPPETPAETPAAAQPAALSGTLLDVPTSYSANTGFKSFMDYRALTNRRSRQYALQQNAYTDEQGFRRYEGYYMIALGSYYASSVGERFRITLENGQSFLAITGDLKSDAHTDRLHQHRGGNIVEFIVDRRQISGTCQRMGDMSYAGLPGRILSIEKLPGLKG